MRIYRPYKLFKYHQKMVSLLSCALAIAVVVGFQFLVSASSKAALDDGSQKRSDIHLRRKTQHSEWKVYIKAIVTVLSIISKHHITTKSYLWRTHLPSLRVRGNRPPTRRWHAPRCGIGLLPVPPLASTVCQSQCTVSGGIPSNYAPGTHTFI